MSITPIEWTQRTWNPVRGCSHVSPGCDNCYAERQGGRFCGPATAKKKAGPFHLFVEKAKGRPRFTGKVELVENMLDAPLHVKEPTTWFVNSMSDLFHQRLPFQNIDRVAAVMARCPWHTFQVLTKRANRMQGYLANDEAAECVAQAIWARNFAPGVEVDARDAAPLAQWPLPNVWFGVSVEDRKRKDRIKYLQDTPAAIRFLSIEPLLEDIGTLDLRGIDWVIVGGESGPGARPFHTQWARSIVEQCREQKVACFVKQLGSHVIQDGERRRKKHRKGGDMHEWPHDIRVREMPKSVAQQPAAELPS